MWNFFLKNSKLTKALIVVMVVFGVYSIISLPKESFPEIDIPFVVLAIETKTKNLQEAENFIVKPVESALLSLAEVDGVRSVISNNRAVVSVVIDPAKDSKFLDNDIEKEVSKILDNNNLVLDYTVKRLSFSEFPSAVLTIGFERQRNEAEIIDITRKRLLDISGIDRIEILDEQAEQVVFIRKDAQVLPAATFAIYESGSVDTIKLAKELEETIEDLNHEYRFRVHFLLSENLISQVKDDLGRLLQSGSITVLFVFLILAVFLGWRSALLASLAIPITYLITFLIMLLTNQTINFLSLFSLLLSLGILIDSSIVITEAFSRRAGQGSLSKDGILDTIRKFSVPLTVGTLTTVMVFLPMLFMSGFIGLFIRAIPLTVSIVLLVSLFVALAVIPVYAKSFYRKKIKAEPSFAKVPRKKNKFTEKYEALLKYLMVKKKRSFAFLFIIMLLFAGSVALPATGAIKVEMFQEGGVEYFFIDVEREKGQSSELHKDVETILFLLSTSSDVEFARVNYGKTGGLTQSPSDLAIITPEGRETANISVTVTNAKVSKEIISQYRNLFDGIFSGNTRVTISQARGGGSSRPIDIVVSSENDVLRLSEANTIESILNNISGIKNIFNDGRENNNVINRLNGVKVTHILADINADKELSDVLFDVRNAISELKSDENVEISYGGEQEEINDSFGSLGVSMLAGIIAIYLLLLWQFKSYKQPFIILVTIPLALVGVFFGLYFIGQNISFPSFIGIVALSGIVVNNAIILLDKINKNSQSGLSKQEAILDASKLRLRPILLTAVTTIFGILPLAISDPVWGPLGYTIIFGLAFSTILTLLVLPVIIRWFGGLKDI